MFCECGVLISYPLFNTFLHNTACITNRIYTHIRRHIRTSNKHNLLTNFLFGEALPPKCRQCRFGTGGAATLYFWQMIIFYCVCGGFLHSFMQYLFYCDPHLCGHEVVECAGPFRPRGSGAGGGWHLSSRLAGRAAFGGIRLSFPSSSRDLLFIQRFFLAFGYRGGRDVFWIFLLLRLTSMGADA